MFTLRNGWLAALLVLAPAAARAQDDAAPATQEPAPPSADQPGASPSTANPSAADQAAGEQAGTDEAAAPGLGGTTPQTQDADTQIDGLRQQLQQQQAEVQRLQQALDERTQETEQLGQVNDQLQSLNDQFADAQARVEAQAQERAASLGQLGQTLVLMQQADTSLALGHGDEVEDALDAAAATLTGQARDWVMAAQDALDQGDLFNARAALENAIGLGVSNQVGGTNQPAAQP